MCFYLSFLDFNKRVRFAIFFSISPFSMIYPKLYPLQTTLLLNASLHVTPKFSPTSLVFLWFFHSFKLSPLQTFKNMNLGSLFSSFITQRVLTIYFCKTRENSNFWKRGKIIISVKKIRNLFSKSWMMKQISSLESSREI